MGYSGVAQNKFIEHCRAHFEFV